MTRHKLSDIEAADVIVALTSLLIRDFAPTTEWQRERMRDLVDRLATGIRLPRGQLARLDSLIQAARRQQ